jgi:hypothetical protein
MSFHAGQQLGEATEVRTLPGSQNIAFDQVTVQENL